MIKIHLPSLKQFPKTGLIGVHVRNPGKWLVEEVRRHYRGSVNSIFYLCNRKVSGLALKEEIESQYKMYKMYSHNTETVIVVGDMSFIITDIYPDPEDKSSKPRLLLLLKDGNLYLKDVRRVINLHLTNR